MEKVKKWASGFTLTASLEDKEENKMYAIVLSGGKQYKAEEGKFIDVEKLDGNVGDKVNLDVLCVSDEKGLETGKPVLSKVKCEAEIILQGKQDKIIVFKYKAKKNERKKQGHRQPFTRVKILSIKRV